MSDVVGYDISIRDRTNPDALINKFPSVLSGKLEVIPLDIFELNDKELGLKAKADVYIERLRLRMWAEYDRALRRNCLIEVRNIYEGTCSREYFLKHIITNSYVFAYICRPPQDLETAMSEAVQLGVEQMREILAMNNFDAEGVFKASLGKLKLEITKELLQRVRGGVVQKVEAKHLHAHTKLEAKTPTNLGEINAKLAELESADEPIQIEATTIETTNVNDGKN